MSKLIDVSHLAELTKLHLTEEEVDEIEMQLTTILDHFANLVNIDTTAVPAATDVIAPPLRMRDDVPGLCLTLEQVLLNAPDTLNDYFRVPHVFGDEAGPETDTD